jgi:diaminohydroxyphosphoribosylaminopyrimidine deaminase/5-amino-6-(5-phosphoribosylamino)uracil reductase
LKLPESLHLFDRSQKTICYNLLKHEVHENLLLIRIPEVNFLEEMVTDLVKQNIQSVIVEGGTHTLQSFIDAGLWDEARVFTGANSFEKGIKAPDFDGEVISEITIFSDQFSCYLPKSQLVTK